jgi:hypothetical protein
MAEIMPPTVNHYFKRSLRELVQEVDQLTCPVNEQHLLNSVLTGGAVTGAIAVNNCEGLSHFWGEGSQTGSRALIRLFAWMMLSQCYRWAKAESPDGGSNLQPINDYGRKLLWLFGDINEADERLLLGLDSQYNYDLDHKPHLTHITSLLLAAGCEICGHRCLEWQKIRFPVREISQLARKRALIDTEPIRTLADINALKAGLNAGITAMMKYHEQIKS